MSGIADVVKLGFLPLQARHDTENVELALRHALFAARTRGQSDEPGDPEFGAARIDSGSAGDILGGFLWQAEAGPEVQETKVPEGVRDVNAWMFAAAAALTEPYERVDGRDLSTTTGDADSGDLVMRPLKSDAAETDQRFREVRVHGPNMSLPAGWPCVVVAGTHEGEQRLIAIPAGGRLVAVERGGDGALSTYVHDVDSQGRVDEQRAARLHSMMRVTAPIEGQVSPGPKDVYHLAWQFKKATPDGLLGGGLIAGEPGGGSVAGSGPGGPRDRAPGEGYGGITDTDMGRTDIGDDPEVRRQRVRETGRPDLTTHEREPEAENRTGPSEVDDGPGGAPSASGPRTYLAFMSHKLGGVVDVGVEGDQHEVGRNHDGEPAHGAHISVQAPFLLDASRDAPMAFEAVPWIEGEPQPVITQVHLRHDSAAGHPWAFGGRGGLWKWQGESTLATPAEDPGHASRPRGAEDIIGEGNPHEPVGPNPNPGPLPFHQIKHLPGGGGNFRPEYPNGPPLDAVAIGHHEYVPHEVRGGGSGWDGTSARDASAMDASGNAEPGFGGGSTGGASQKGNCTTLWWSPNRPGKGAYRNGPAGGSPGAARGGGDGKASGTPGGTKGRKKRKRGSGGTLPPFGPLGPPRRGGGIDIDDPEDTGLGLPTGGRKRGRIRIDDPEGWGGLGFPGPVLNGTNRWPYHDLDTLADIEMALTPLDRDPLVDIPDSPQAAGPIQYTPEPVAGRDTASIRERTSSLRVLPLGDEERRPYSASPMDIALPALLARPQLQERGAVDLEYDQSPTRSDLARHDEQVPLAARLQAFAAESGREWERTRNRQGGNRGGTAPGGFMLYPPEIGPREDDDLTRTDILAQVAAGDLTSAYLGIHPACALAWGQVDRASGTVRDGWRFSNIPVNGRMDVDYIDEDGEVDPSKKFNIGGQFCVSDDDLGSEFAVDPTNGTAVLTGPSGGSISQDSEGGSLEIEAGGYVAELNAPNRYVALGGFRDDPIVGVPGAIWISNGAPNPRLEVSDGVDCWSVQLSPC